MFEVDHQLLRNIILANGVSGDETDVCFFLENLLKCFSDSIFKDRNGNLILFKKGHLPNRKKVMVAAHTDELGFIVKHIDKGGFVRFLPIGGIDLKTIIAQQVLILGDSVNVEGIIVFTDNDDNLLQMENCFIDTGLSEEEVRSKISVGNMIVRVSPPRMIGNCICAKSLDNRVGVYIAAKVLQSIKSPPHDIYVAFCTQEEVGLRGSRVATKYIKPDISINVDITPAGCLQKEEPPTVGLGPAIKFMDASTISDRSFLQYVSTISSSNDIPLQYKVSNTGGTDTASMQYITGHGSIAVALSIPISYTHSSVEMASVDDIKNSTALLYNVLMSDLKISSYNL